MRLFPSDDALPRPLADIEAFLLRERGVLEPHEIPDAERLRTLRLDAYTYSRHRIAEHRDALLRATARHQRIKSELLPLLRAWHEVRIETLLYKGFALAEFVYAVPAERFHGDVDVAVREERLPEARRIALELGWKLHIDWQDTFFGHRHEAMVLRRGPVYLEVHRWLLQSGRPGSPRPGRITDAVWTRSLEVSMNDVPVRILHPADAFLVGLALQRTTSDRWSAKPHDYPDARALVSRYTLERSAVEVRAAELRETRSLERYLSMVDPWLERLQLLRPGRATRLRWALAAWPERTPVELEKAAAKLTRIPGIARDVAAALPVAQDVKRSMRETHAIHELLAELTPDALPEENRNLKEIEHVVRGARWATRLLWARRRDLCVPRSLVGYRMLRMRGHPAVFVSGVRREKGALKGHAWVELDGYPLPLSGDTRAPVHYQPSLRFPAED